MTPYLSILLAQAAEAADPLKQILPWVTTFVVAVLSVVLGKKMGKAEAQGMRVEGPVPTVPTTKVPGFVTWDHLQPIITRMDRLEKHLDDVRKEQSDQFKQILEAGSTRETRLTTHVDDIARAIHSRLDDVIRDYSQPKLPRGR